MCGMECTGLLSMQIVIGGMVEVDVVGFLMFRCKGTVLALGFYCVGCIYYAFFSLK